MRAFLALGLLAAGLAAAGCGGGSSPGEAAANGEASKPAQQVLSDAVKAANAASGVHMTGHLDHGFGYEVSWDATFVKGKGGTATVTDFGKTVDLVVLGDPLGTHPAGSTIYLRGSSAWWEYFDHGFVKNPSSLDGKWVEVSVTDFRAMVALGDWAQYADPKFLLHDLTTHMGALTKKSMTYKGQSVVALYGPSKTSWAFVAATGKPYPLFVGRKDGTPASLSFDGWGKTVSVSAPSGAIEVSKLEG